jgi:hypothetical protein
MCQIRGYNESARQKERLLLIRSVILFVRPVFHDCSFPGPQSSRLLGGNEIRFVLAGAEAFLRLEGKIIKKRERERERRKRRSGGRRCAQASR